MLVRTIWEATQRSWASNDIPVSTEHVMRYGRRIHKPSLEGADEHYESMRSPGLEHKGTKPR